MAEHKRVCGKIDENYEGRDAPAPIDPETGQHGGHYVLSEAERARGFIRPLRMSYKHESCSAVTSMPVPIAETYARQPIGFYARTFCCKCRSYGPVGPDGDFVWLDGGKVGT